jgi:hypothetical protein
MPGAYPRMKLECLSLAGLFSLSLVNPIVEHLSRLRPFFQALEKANKLEIFVLDRPFQLSLMFVSKSGAYPQVEHLKCASL